VNTHIDESMATLRLAASSLDPKVVTEILGANPQVAARKGEYLYQNSKSQAVARTGTWFTTTEGSIELKPSDHLAKLLSMVSPHIKKLRRLMPDLKVSFSLFVEDSFYPNLPADLKRRIEMLGTLEIEVAGFQKA
jgi:hypothetical protein